MGMIQLNEPATFFLSVHDELANVESLMRSQGQGAHPDLQAALELIISSGGKRVRPTLTILAGKLLRAPQDTMLSLATAIEMLHTATLVHDDLIDGALLRRGSPTLNSHWSPGATVLTGDFMFAKAALLAASTECIPAIKLFSETLGVIVNGEISQLFGNRCRIDLEDYYRRIYAKTASLFETAAKSAAMVANADASTVEALRGYGYEIGMAFQIIDDVFDFVADQTTLGKPVGSDLRQGIVTLPTIRYAQAHPEDPDTASLLAGDCFTDNNQIDRLIHAIRASSAIQESLAEAAAFVERGVQSLHRLPDLPERQALEDLARYFVNRKI